MSITATEVGEQVNSVAIALEDRLRPALASKNYGGGVEQFVVFIVSVDAHPLENERYCIANNRAGRYKDMMTGRMVSFVGIAVPVNPEAVRGSSSEGLDRHLHDLLLKELGSPAYAMPKAFDRQRLFEDVVLALR
ncbi:MAG TPA: hypothetical protein VD932_06295 [Aquabacterium sp.]|nr:hypothetical protein [Aquabacterium sp.]